MKPILSIIIPTKNRYTYLESCLKAISFNYNRPDVEIIITDNSSIKKNIKSLSLFSNIHYSYSAEPISQVENFENAMSKVSGEYVTMIGDDDGLSSTLLEVTYFLKSKNKQALIAPFVSYYWPDIISNNIINQFSGKIFHKKYNYEIYDISVKNEIDKSLKLGGGSLCRLPRMYYGIIRKDILDKVKNESGSFFPGPSPDMANAFSAAIYTETLTFFDAPLFIAGNSAHSAAGIGLAGKHIGKIKGNPMLPKDCHLNWTAQVPKFWSGPTIWAESLLKSAVLTGKTEYIEKFNYARLYANCFVFHSIFSKEVNEAIKQNMFVSSYFWLRLAIKVEIFKIILLRLKYFCKNISKRFTSYNSVNYSNISDIEIASSLINKYEELILRKLNSYVSQ